MLRKGTGAMLKVNLAKANLSENAKTVLESRYLKKGDDGQPIETPEEMFWRVASSTAEAERLYVPASEGDAAVQRVAEEFYEMMCELDFIPNSPALMNAGRELGQYFACFVIPVEDAVISKDDSGIFDSVRSAAHIHKSGGGTGFSFSRLRPEGSRVSTSHGVSSGPVSFMKVFNEATNAINQGGFRRGANMAVMRVDHPDILDFINLKSDLTEMTNFNLSVTITDDFIEAAHRNEVHMVVDPSSGKTHPLRSKIRDDLGNISGWDDHEWTATEVLDLITQRAWETGEPGIVFIDRVNTDNPTPQLGEMESTNPCGEQPLLPFEACNLGSVNLSRFVLEDAIKDSSLRPEEKINWERLGKVTRKVARFLDNVIDVNKYPKTQIEKVVKGNRKIGLGIMGWADLLYYLGIPYDSEDAIRLAGKVMKFVKDEGWKMSMDLADERGAFPNFEGSLFETAELSHKYFTEEYRERARTSGARPKIRNSTVTTIAPTGTISIIAGTSGGIEPVYSLVFYRKVLNGKTLAELHPYFSSIAEVNGFYSEEMIEQIAVEGKLRNIKEVPEKWKKLFVTSMDIAPEWHVRMQAAFQQYTDNAVSKTVNFSQDASREDIRRVYDLAAELGLKGVTVYRDGSRKNQAMSLKGSNEKHEESDAEPQDAPAAAPAAAEPDAMGRPKRRPLPDMLRGVRYRMPTNLGYAYVTITEDEQGPRECFTSIGKAGSDITAGAEAICRLISTALGYGVPIESIARQLLNITSTPVPTKDGWVKSLPDAIGQALLKYIQENNGEEHTTHHVRRIGKPTGALCPDCGAPLIFEEGCNGGKCNTCGFSRC